jgi:NADP-dependent 3-hydroxy acid dehydrogenase YdfG
LEAADVSELNGNPVPLRKGGTYLIAGGAHGLGYETAQWLAREYQAKLILLGRRALAEPIWNRLECLERAGGTALYVRADLCDALSLQRALELGRAELGSIEGVIHSAMLLHDGLLASLDESEFAAPLGPKMSGLENLREALRQDPLAFALLYSSVQSLLGNAGQGSYACASAFADSYAEVWRTEASYPVKTVNWSYWGSAGAVAGEEYRRRMQAVGVESIEAEEAFPILQGLLASSLVDQLWVIKAGDRFLRLIGLDAGPRKQVAAVSSAPSLLGRSLALLRGSR